MLFRIKKDLDFIRESCRITAGALEACKKYAKPGITTIELDRIAEDYILSQGGKAAFKGYRVPDTIPFPASICSSVDDVVVHGIPNDRVLKEGEILSIDCGVVKNGFYGDAAITIPIGEVSILKKKLMKATEESLYLGLEQAINGNRVNDIGHAVQSHVESNGFSVVRDLCGHGVGKKLHEAPQIPNYGRRGTGQRLKAGMTLAIEPMVNAGTYEVFFGLDGWTVKTADGLPSAHFEHTVLVQDNKPEILTIV